MIFNFLSPEKFNGQSGTHTTVTHGLKLGLHFHGLFHGGGMAREQTTVACEQHHGLDPVRISNLSFLNVA